MLSSISWQHYLAAIVILALFYYGFIILRYYQKEIDRLLNRGKNNSNPFNSVISGPFPVMGKAKQDPGVTLSGAEEMYFAEVTPDRPEVFHRAEQPISGVQGTDTSPAVELLLESGNLIEAFQGIDDKPGFIKLLQILIKSYTPFKPEFDWPVVLEEIKHRAEQKLLFSLTLAELQQIEF